MLDATSPSRGGLGKEAELYAMPRAPLLAGAVAARRLGGSAARGGAGMPITNLPYDGRLNDRAFDLRHEMTSQEKRLWYAYLRTYPVKVYRQRVIEHFIVDFYCPLARLVIELDGSQHYTEQGKEYDEQRTAILEQYGVQVLRFTNLDVDRHLDAVCAQIDATIQHRIADIRY